MTLRAYDRGGGTGTGGGGLGYVICNTACESPGSVWQDQLFEANAALDTDWPAAGSAAGFWYGGYRPSLALDAGGNPFVGYYATHICNSCGNGGLPMENWRAARFAFAGSPTPCCVKVYLPFIKR